MYCDYNLKIYGDCNLFSFLRSLLTLTGPTGSWDSSSSYSLVEISSFRYLNIPGTEKLVHMRTFILQDTYNLITNHIFHENCPLCLQAFQTNCIFIKRSMWKHTEGSIIKISLISLNYPPTKWVHQGIPACAESNNHEVLTDIFPIIFFLLSIHFRCGS